MQWLVVIDEEGVQAQYLMGKDTKKAAKEETGLKDKAKCLFKTHERLKIAFEYGYDPVDEKSSTSSIKAIKQLDWDEQRRWNSEFQDFYNKMREDLSKRYSASGPREKYGYDIRKTTLRNYIEVLAELDAKDYNEFHKNYQGLPGAIDILYSTISLLHPHVNSSSEASDKIIKWTTKLKNEEDLKD
jgi:hypothetical protein